LGFVPVVRAQLAVWSLSNKDIEIQTGFIPIRLEINSPAAQELRGLGPPANWALERALADPKRFAAAHVLLTEINERRFSMSHTHWNNMRVSSSSDFHTEQIPDLQEFWRERLAEKSSNAE